ncbi:MAG TPA: hypothetical protein VK071_07325 [Tissierellales bacterium]|nr:hypothetical protein [Tissierellales bacterium]
MAVGASGDFLLSIHIIIAIIITFIASKIFNKLGIPADNYRK